MSAPAFTAGPWELRYHGEMGGTKMFWVNDTTSICAQNEADANLIAASPDLHDAVVALVECFIKRGPFDEPLGSSEQAPSINAGIAALRKARGQS